MSHGRPGKPIVFFDIETGGFSMNDDILQIAAKYGNSTFNMYAKSTKKINPEASLINGLTSNRWGTLFRNGVKLNAYPLYDVLEEFHEFLDDIGRPCVLVAHNCNFDANRLVYRARQFDMEDDFSDVIDGFTCTLRMLKRRFPQRGGKGAFKLDTLARDFSNVKPTNSHDALHDVKLLEGLVNALNISYGELARKRRTYDSVLDAIIKKEQDKW